MYFLDVEIFTGKNCFVKAAAVGAIALILHHVEYFIAVVTLSKTGNNFKDELCILEFGILGNNGIEFLNIFRNDQRKLADFANYFAYTLDIVFLRIVENSLAHTSYYSYFVHLTSCT